MTNEKSEAAAPFGFYSSVYDKFWTAAQLQGQGASDDLLFELYEASALDSLREENAALRKEIDDQRNYIRHRNFPAAPRIGRVVARTQDLYYVLNVLRISASDPIEIIVAAPSQGAKP